MADELSTDRTRSIHFLLDLSRILNSPKLASMLLRQVRQTARRRSLIFWIVFALLFGQGLRVCLHALDGDDPAHATPIHVESVFTGTEDNSSSSLDRDSLLPALLKTIFSALVFCALATTAFFPLLSAARYRYPLFWKICLPSFRHHWLTPPGHAPPR